MGGFDTSLQKHFAHPRCNFQIQVSYTIKLCLKLFWYKINLEFNQNINYLVDNINDLQKKIKNVKKKDKPTFW